MDLKGLQTLEFDKVRERLAEHTTFSAGHELALALLPDNDFVEVERRQAETREARILLGQKGNLSLGGVHDVRPLLPAAIRGSMLVPSDLLQIRDTLARARTVRQTLTRLAGQFPHLSNLGARIEEVPGLVAEIDRAIDDRGEVKDSASDDLARIRRELRSAHDRLMSTLERFVRASGNAEYLQEALVTQRNGRYVIPLRAEFKGRIPGLVHDQSSSGATLFIEPLATVELNNRWREAQLEEEKEVRRILTELSELVGEEAPYIQRTVEVLAEVDLIFAKARYAEAVRATQPELVPFPKGKRERPRVIERQRQQAEAAGEPEINHPGAVLDLRRARHPLLNPETAVPIDLHLGDDYFMLVITGPNTGGKTVTLKTAGLLAAMTQAGMAIPAVDGSRISVFDHIFADIGDEQSIEQSLSTFSSHLRNIIHILDAATPHSLVLLDELGAGTDPEEGSALAQALLNHFLATGITTLATSHYTELKVFAHTTPGIVNASVEFDVESLAPTYELSIGLPGRSNALAIARRLGLDQAILDAAQSMVRPESMETDELLADIKRAREETEARLTEAEERARRAAAQEAELRTRLAAIEEARRQVLNEARTEAQAELEATRREIEQVRARLSATGPGLHEAWLAEAQEILDRREAEQTPIQPDVPADGTQPEGPLAVGERVWVPSLQASGVVTELGNGEVELQIGAFRLRLPTNRIERRSGEESPLTTPAERHQQGAALDRRTVSSLPRTPSISTELDLRGQRVEDVLPRIDKYIDDAYLAGALSVRIIHGKGTGTLRRVIREELGRNSLVASQRSGENNEGGDGVTVATLVQR